MMSQNFNSENWPETGDPPAAQGKVVLHSTLWTAFAAMVLGALFMGQMANAGFGPFEEPETSAAVQILGGVAAGGIIGFIGGALVGGAIGLLAAALLERDPDGRRAG
jgi:hypothetical protein